MKTLRDLKKEDLSEEKIDDVYNFIGKLRSQNEDYEAFDLDLKDLKIDEEGNIYYPTDFHYKKSSYSDEGTGYNMVDESEFTWLDYEKIN